MRGNGIPLDKAELLSVLMEGMLYGLSVLMFGGTIWALLSRQSTHRVDHKVFVVACLLLLLSTAHFAIDVMRVMEGFVLYRDTFPGGPIGYFADVSQWTLVSMNYVFAAQTLLGDGVALYRCYAVWQSKYIMIVPMALWYAVGVTGIGSAYTASQATQDGVFGGALSRWITSYWASALATNLITTALLAGRIWWVDRKTVKFHGPGKSQLRPILYIVIDAGVIYSLTLLVAITCFLCRSNFQYVILPMVTPIISITFYMVIIRVELANRAKPMVVRSTSTEMSLRPGSQMQVHTTTLTENKIDETPSSMMGLPERDSQDVGMAV